MPMLIVLFPFAEIYAWYLFIDRYSFVDALLLVITTGALGFFVMTIHGRATIMSVQNALAQGEMPEGNLLHRGAIIFGGMLLAVPGLISKVLGTLLILPGTRHVLVIYLKIFIAGKIAKGSFHVFAAGNLGGFAAKGFRAENRPEARDVVEIKPKSIEHQDKNE